MFFLLSVIITNILIDWFIIIRRKKANSLKKSKNAKIQRIYKIDCNICGGSNYELANLGFAPGLGPGYLQPGSTLKITRLIAIPH